MKKSFKFGLKISEYMILYMELGILVWVLKKDQKYQNFQNIEFAIKERLNHVALICQNISYDTSYWKKNGGTDFLDVPSKNLLFAAVPKVGCTNWKKVIMFLENKITPEQRSIALQKGIVLFATNQGPVSVFVGRLALCNFNIGLDHI